MKTIPPKQLNVTHTGLFSSRCGALIDAITDETIEIDISMGLGMHANGKKLGVLIGINDRFATVFTAKEAEALAEIFADTMANEDPPTRRLKEMLTYIVDGCRELSEQLREFDRARVDRKLN